jgi:hypothetical protein
VLHRLETVVGDGDSVRIARKVAQDLLGAGEGGLAVDDPVLACGVSKKDVALGRGRTEHAGIESLLEFLQKLAPEDPREDSDGEQEFGFGLDPTVTLGAETSAGDDAVEVRVIGQSLGPGVEDGGEADACPQVFGPARNVLEGLGDGTEEESVAKTGVPTQEGMKHVGDGEDDVVILDG